jgi:DNA-binding NtrC family response regulator
VVSRLIHMQSARSHQSFVAVNCSGIPETLLTSELFGHVRGSFTGAYRDKPGLVRQADRGTLFLDELGEMSLAMQAALLRFTETGEIHPVGADAPVGRTDVRLITATNRDLRAEVAAGTFREDLFYRLNVIQLNVPPLRERGDDILLLFEHYLREAAATHNLPCSTMSPDVAPLLLAYRWPGNVRELRNLTERIALINADRPITAHDLPLDIREPRVVQNRTAAAAPAPPSAETPSGATEETWTALLGGGDFWSVVQQRFRAREMTRQDLQALIDRGLRHTRGSYRALVRLFNMPESDYKRFHAFLYQQQCNLPVASYRRNVRMSTSATSDALAASSRTAC